MFCKCKTEADSVREVWNSFKESIKLSSCFILNIQSLLRRPTQPAASRYKRWSKNHTKHIEHYVGKMQSYLMLNK